MSLIKKTVKGVPVWLNLTDNGISRRLIITDGDREKAFDWIIKKEASGIAFDIGANLGWVSMQLAKKCKVVYAFEPDPRNYKLLMKNAKRRRIDTFPNAISDTVGWVRMEFAKKPNLNTICTDKGTKVSCITIDYFLKAFSGAPNFIKMDIEGGEVAALRGASNFFKVGSNIKILMEMHPEKYGASNNMADELKTLVSYGFNAKYVVNAKGRLKNFQSFETVKYFPGFPRVVWKGLSNEETIHMATKMPSNGKKLVRSILWEKL